MLENDLVGVGAGPTNLSLAALIETARSRGLITLRSKFLEENPAIRWHSGQLFPGTLMQTEFYRDLVTPVDLKLLLVSQLPESPSATGSVPLL
jgi:lysine/ornithine N-monooxygenase